MSKENRKLIIKSIVSLIFFTIVCSISISLFASWINYGSSKSSVIQEKVQPHIGSPFLKDDEDSVTVLYLTGDELSEAQNAYNTVINSCTASNWYNCGNHSKYWKVLESYGIFSYSDVSSYTLAQMKAYVETMWGKVITQVDQVEGTKISVLMTFLNNEGYDINGGTSTGYYALMNFKSFFCLKHGQAIGRYHDYLERDHESDQDVSNWIQISYDTNYKNAGTYKLEKYDFPDSGTLDYFDYDAGEEGDIQTTKSNVKYFCSDYQDIYTIYNGFGTYRTNVFAYATAYSQKYTGIKYSEERAQLGIWAVVGNPANGEPNIVDISDLNTLEEGSEDSDNETTIQDTSAITNSELYNAGGAVDEYEGYLTENISGDDKASKHKIALEGTDSNLRNNPEVKIFTNSGSDEFTNSKDIGSVNDSTGTTIFEKDGTYYYKIGPFQMGDYALAASDYVVNYSGSGLSYSKIVGGIVGGTATFVNESGNTTSTARIGIEATVEYTDMRGNSTSKGENNVTGNYTYTPDEDYYPFPYPDSVFYIVIKKDDCGEGAVKLSEMSFDYRQTKTDGNGWVIQSKYIYTQWTRKSEGVGCWTYHATCSQQPYGNNKYIEINASKGGDLSIGHYHYYDCDDHDEGCGCGGHDVEDEEGNTTTEYYSGCNCACNGHLYYCTAVNTFRCEHEHTDCRVTHWKNTSGPTVIAGQPFLALHDSNVTVQKTPVISKLDVRLTTDVTINKYIYDVEHVVSPSPNQNSETLANSGYDSTLTAGDGRSYVDEETKKNNPVYVEYGDIVTYHIDIKNDQGQTIELKLRDIYPDNSKLLSVENLSTSDKYTVSSSTSTSADFPLKVIKQNEHYFTTDWVSVPKGTVTLEVKVKVMDWEDEEIWENNASIITRNAGYLGSVSKDVVSIDYMRTDIEERPGPVVNLAELDSSKKKESSDFYKLNNYNAFIDKYLYTYDESVRVDNVNNLKLSNEDTLVETKNGISNVLKSFQSNANLAARERLSDSVKQGAPVPVEKDEVITYQIKVTNEAESVDASVSGANKPATQVRTDKITDLMEVGLQFEKVEAKQYNADGTICSDYYLTGSVPVTSTYVGIVTENGRTYNKYEYDITTSTILNPGEYIIYTVTVKITESDLYLYDLDNYAELTILSNINHEDSKDKDGEKEREIKNDTRDENISTQETSHEYIRMKDLIIGGKVWLDFNKNGLMDDTISDYIGQVDMNQETSDSFLSYTDGATKLSTYYNINENAMMKDIVVKLYKSDGTLVRTTKTDSNGIFTFARGEDGVTFYETQYYNLDSSRKYSSNKTYERIDKATGKDENGNYTSGSQYIEYYIEYEYDGVVYKSTAYSGKDHLNDDGSYKGSECNHLFETNTEGYASGNYMKELSPTEKKYKYEYDSNANEFVATREDFNTKYEYITYNQAYSLSGAAGEGSTLEFDKTGHTSQLLVDNEHRIMTARSFIEEIAQPNTQEATNYIPLFGYSSSDCTVPYSRYLKFINLGLELREDVDISLTKDVYKVTTTIKGEEMEYNFNINTIVNGKVLAEIENNYKLDEPYGIELYESDYKYRNEQYSSVEAVENYFGDTSELNVEVTYRIRVDNNKVHKDGDLNDPESLNSNYDKKNFEDTEKTNLYVKVDELIDLYDENFIEYTQDMENGTVEDYILARTMDETTGRFASQDKQIKVAEAWYYAPDDNGDYILDETTGIYVKISEGVTVDATTQRYKVVELEVSNSSKKTSTNEYINTSITSSEYLASKGAVSREDEYIYEKANSGDNLYLYDADGYHKLYIRPKTEDEAVVIPEGEHYDFFVKYVLDTDSEKVTITNENFGETQTITNSTTSNSSSIVTNADGSISASWYEATETQKITYNSEVWLSASLMIEEKTQTDMKELFGLATENIAQINMYSVWYDEDATIPTSIVDRDSNAGNVGMEDTINKVVGSADDKEFYEDTIYKTGINITAQGTANIPDVGETTDRTENGGNYNTNIIRTISGQVWDDARTENADNEDKEAVGQYIGNGLKLTSDTAIANAKKNELVPIVKGENTTEEKDISVSSARVEFIEIIETDEDTYYEMLPSDVMCQYQQHIRTDEDGTYKLYGYVPGKYVVRFTYGDDISATGENEQTISGSNASQEDMYLFNGQDYKSTQYTTPDLTSPTTDASGNVTGYNVLDDNVTLYSGTKAANDAKIDQVIESLEAENYNDARDDEIRRLEVNSYSEIMNNMIAEVLQGMANGYTTDNINISSITNNSEENSEEELKALVDNTWMYAETIPFTVRAEKITQDMYTTNNITKLIDDVTYASREQVENQLTYVRQFDIQNVDFGIEYRAENAIQLEKDIKEIKVTTESDEVIVDLFFYTEYADDYKESKDTGTTAKTHYLDTEKSVGLDMVQFISNEYEVNELISGLISESSLEQQGFVYINYDIDIQQGATIEVTYEFIAENHGEIDRIAQNLDNIRYQNNYVTQTLGTAVTSNLITGTDNLNGTINYRANLTAANEMINSMYEKDSQGIFYRTSPKVLTDLNGSRSVDATAKDGGVSGNKLSYYGYYSGYVYYTGDAETAGDYDTVAELKFNKILDYVDKDMLYLDNTKGSETIDKNWSVLDNTYKDYYSLISWARNDVSYIASILNVENGEDKVKSYIDDKLLKLNISSIYSTEELESNGTIATVVDEISGASIDPDGYIYSNMVVSADTGMYTDIYTDANNTTISEDEVIAGTNPNLARFLLPMIADDDTNDYTSSRGRIDLTVSKAISAETTDDELEYQNIAEIVEFTTLTGRRTNFATTIGNVDVRDLDIIDPDNPSTDSNNEYPQSTPEPDQSAAEVITLIPPQGLMSRNKVIKEVVEIAKTGVGITVIVVAVVAVIVFVTIFGMKKYSKRRIK